MSSKYEVIGELGQGCFGIVSKVREKSTGKEFAMKKIPSTEDNKIYGCQSEVDMNKMLRSKKPDYILYSLDEFEEKVFGVVFKCLVFPFCNSGTLEDYLTKNILDEEQVSDILRQLVAAVRFCHSENIIHRDIRPSNILLHYENHHFHVYLSDFGIAKKGAFAKSALAHHDYQYPEIHSGVVTEKADIWLIGATTFEMLTRERYNKEKQDLKNVSMWAKSFLECCLQKEPGMRSNIKELSEHPFIVNYEAQINIYLKELTSLKKKNSDFDSKLKTFQLQIFKLLDDNNFKLGLDYKVKPDLDYNFNPILDFNYKLIPSSFTSPFLLPDLPFLSFFEKSPSLKSSFKSTELTIYSAPQVEVGIKIFKEMLKRINPIEKFAALKKEKPTNLGDMTNNLNNALMISAIAAF
jgi:serine/threonine protein kinase